MFNIFYISIWQWTFKGCKDKGIRKVELGARKNSLFEYYSQDVDSYLFKGLKMTCFCPLFICMFLVSMTRIFLASLSFLMRGILFSSSRILSILILFRLNLSSKSSLTAIFTLINVPKDLGSTRCQNMCFNLWIKHWSSSLRDLGDQALILKLKVPRFANEIKWSRLTKSAKVPISVQIRRFKVIKYLLLWCNCCKFISHQPELEF